MINYALQVPSRVRSWTQSVPIVIWTLVMGALLNSIGNSFLWPLNTLYINTVLEKSLTTAGIVLMFMNGAGVLGNLLGGSLFDRVGGKAVILIGLISSSCFVLLVGFIHSWPFYVGAMILLGFTQSMVMPAFNALLGQLWPEGGRRAFNLFYVTNNLGVAIGTAIGGFLAEISFFLVFFLNGLSYLIYVGFFLYALRGKGGKQNENAEHANFAILKNRSDAVQPAASIVVPVIFLAAGIMIAWTAYSQWAGPIAIYTKTSGYSLTSYGFLWTLNGILIVVGQPFLTKILKHFMQRISVQIIVGGILYTITFALISFHPNYNGFLVGMAILTIGEMIILPGVPTAISIMAPKDKMGFYQGITASAGTAGRMLGPVFGGIVYDTSGAIPLFIFGSIACFIATLSFFGFHISTRKRVL